jgi:NIMA-interacting peptidyl-prolyl cis-trans isomerase 1
MMRTVVVSSLLVLSLFACGGGASEAPAAAAPAASSTTTSAPTPTPAPATATPAASASAAAPKTAPTKISARHVLIQWMGAQNAAPSVVRTREQALVVAKDVLRRARAGEDFARLAVEFSDEPNAGQRGGSLGRFGKGAMVKAFEEAAFALQPGEISDVVESPFGYHVIQRTE